MEDLVVALLGSDRDDVPPAFSKALGDRLTSGRRFREVDRGRPFYREAQRRRRNMFIRGVYRQIGELLGCAPTVEHPILGTIDVPAGDLTKSEKSLKMTADVLRNRLGEDPPSPRTMLNIITAKR
jgi:hypothetical protein